MKSFNFRTSTIISGMAAMVLSALSNQALAQSEQPLISGRISLAIDRVLEEGTATNSLEMPEGRIIISKPGMFSIGDKACLDGHAKFDIRPLVGRKKIKEEITAELAEGIETTIRVMMAQGMSKATGRQIDPSNVTVPPGMLQAAMDNFTAPEKGFEGRGIEEYATYLTRASAITDATIRESYLRVNFGGCQRSDDETKVDVLVGKADPVHFNDQGTSHWAISGPTVRVSMKMSRVMMYMEIKNDRGSVFHPAGDAPGMVRNIVSRGKNILSYSPNYYEAGARINAGVVRILGAIAKKSDSYAVIAQVDNKDTAWANRIADFSGSVVIERKRGGDLTKVSDVIIHKELFNRLNLQAQRFAVVEEKGSREQRMNSLSFAVSTEIARILGDRVGIEAGAEVYANKWTHEIIPDRTVKNKGASAFFTLAF